MLNLNPLHIAWTHADAQAVQGEVGLKQESLGALECILHYCTTNKDCFYVEYGSIAHNMDPCRRPGSSGRGWLGTRESWGTGVQFFINVQLIKFVPMMNIDRLHIARTLADL